MGIQIHLFPRLRRGYVCDGIQEGSVGSCAWDEVQGVHLEAGRKQGRNGITQSSSSTLPPSPFVYFWAVPMLNIGCMSCRVVLILILIYVGVPWEATELGGVYEGDVRDGGFDCC